MKLLPHQSRPTTPSAICATAGLLIGALGLGACSGGGGWGGASAPAVAAPQIGYSVPGLELLARIPMHPLEAQLVGDPPTQISVAPPLPAGLVLDPLTGTLSGSPAASSPATTYRITAANDGGQSSVSLALEVLAEYEHARFAYVTNFVDNTISCYVVDADSGVLRPNGALATGDKPLTAVPYPSGEFLYVTNYAQATLSVYRVDAHSGALELVEIEPTGNQPVGVAIDHAGEILYLSLFGSNALSAFAIDRQTGALEPLGAPVAAISPSLMVLSPDGRFLYASFTYSNSIGIYEVDGDSGELALLDAIPCGTSPIGIALAPDGATLVSANFESDDLTTFHVDPGTGTLTEVEVIATHETPSGLCFDRDSRLYLTNFEVSRVSVFDASGGADALYLIDQVVVGNQPLSVIPSPTGERVYATNLRSHEVSRLQVSDPAPFVGPDPSLPLGQVRSQLGASGIALVTAAHPLGYRPLRVYAANPLLDDIACLDIDAATGLLTEQALPVSSTGGPIDLALAPDGGALYAANPSTSTVTAYAIDPLTGALDALGPPQQAAPECSAVGLHPSGQRLYSAGLHGVFGSTLDAGSGALGPFAAVAAGNGERALAIDPSGRFAAVLDHSLNRIEIYRFEADGVGLVQALNSPFDNSQGYIPSAVTFHSSGRFVYVANAQGNTVAAFSIDAVLGDLTQVDDQFCGFGPADLACHPLGETLYVANAKGGTISVLRVSALSGSLQLIDTTATASPNPTRLEVDPSGRYLYVSDALAETIAQYAIDAQDGTLTSLGEVPLATGAGHGGLAVSGLLEEFE